MDLSKLYPVAGDHAIQQVIFAIDWDQPLQSSDFIAKFEATCPEILKKDFLSPKKATGITVQFTDGVQSVSHNEIAGLNFERHNSFGAITRFVSLSKENFLIGFNEYTRWAEIFAIAKQYLESAFSNDLNSLPIASFGLQYTDVFDWKSDKSLLDYECVFNKESPYLPKHALGLKDLWHSHHGYFETLGKPFNSKILDNVNINVVDNGAIRSVQITTSHRVMLNDALWGYNDHKENHYQLLDDLHQRNKRIIKEMLSKEVLERINLG